MPHGRKLAIDRYMKESFTLDNPKLSHKKSDLTKKRELNLNKINDKQKSVVKGTKKKNHFRPHERYLAQPRNFKETFTLNN